MKLDAMIIVACVALAAFSFSTAMAQEYCPLPHDTEILTPHVWPVLDANGDGLLTFEELYALDSAFERWQFLLVDENRDGYISQEEALPWVTEILPYAFDYIDKNRNGAIEFSEVSHIISLERFALADINGDGIFDCQDLGALPPDYPMPCFNNLVQDANFSAGAAGSNWIATTDALFCSAAVCEDGQPYKGNGFLRFYPRMTDDVLSVEQEILFPVADRATLTYHYHATSESQGWLVVTLGDALIDTVVVSGADGGYVARAIDISAFADGSAQMLMIANPSLGGSYLDIGQVCVQTNGGVYEEPSEGESGSACPLPLFSATEGILLAWPHLDLNGDGSLYLREIQAVYPQFDPAWFNWFDTNNNGEIGLQEALNVVQTLVGKEDIVAFVDLDGNRLLAYAEVSALLTQEQFDFFDHNGNEVFDCDDLAWLQQLPPSPPPLVDDPDEEGEDAAEGEVEVVEEGEDAAEGEVESVEEGEDDNMMEGEGEDEQEEPTDPGDDTGTDTEGEQDDTGEDTNPDDGADDDAPEGEIEDEEENGDDAEGEDSPVEEPSEGEDVPLDDTDDGNDADEQDDEAEEGEDATVEEPEVDDNDDDIIVDDTNTEGESEETAEGEDNTTVEPIADQEGEDTDSPDSDKDDTEPEDSQAGCLGKQGGAEKMKRFLADYLLLGIAGIMAMRLSVFSKSI